jgi:16S rRNA (uracil1498-N3)-methyltransferase
VGARRFFVQGERGIGDWITIDGADAHKIASVLRLRVGDALEIVDSASQLFDARLDRVDDAVVASLVAKREVEHMPRVAIDVAQGIPKGAKMDFVVEKLTELGVSSIVPLESERTVVRDVSGPKLQRWQRIAQAAAQQCARTSIPEIAAPVTLLALTQRFPLYDLVLLPWEAADHTPLRETLPQLALGKKRILILIGPEGGFSHGEADAAVAAGAHAISLGKRILRTETAALVVLSVLNYIVQ